VVNITLKVNFMNAPASLGGEHRGPPDDFGLSSREGADKRKKPKTAEKRRSRTSREEDGSSTEGAHHRHARKRYLSFQERPETTCEEESFPREEGGGQILN